MKRILLLLSALPLFVSCGPYKAKYWRVALNPQGTEAATLAATCFPMEAANSNRANNTTTWDALRVPSQWTTWEGKDKQFFLETDALISNLIAALGRNAPNDIGGLGDSALLLESTDAKVFRVSQVRKAQSPGDMQPVITETRTVTVTFAALEPATTGTIDVSVSRACTGATTDACMGVDYSCSFPALPFTARQIEDVQTTRNIEQ